MFGFKISPSVVLFSLILFGGVVVTLVSPSVLGAWFGMEVNLFAAIPLFCGKSGSESVSCVKYFVFQALGSGFIFLSLLVGLGLGCFMGLGLKSFLVGGLMVLGMSLKLGLFPCHLWVPEVVSGLGWLSCFLLMVVQKLAPIWVVGGIGLCDLWVFLLMCICCLTSFFGALGGLSQVSVRCLLAYSSLVHSGWVVVVSLVSVFVFFSYMLLYCVILAGLILGLQSLGFSNLYSSSGVIGGVFVNNHWVWVGLYFMSLAGVPPFSGMFMKIMSVVVLCGVQPVFLAGLIVASLISLYFYLGIFFSIYLSWGGSGVFGGFLLGSLTSSNWLGLSIFLNLLLSPVVLVSGVWFFLG
uniref:NADH-ubiquinone oxidoreductase chain 2 n=1 Tax=Solen strictus TaxID=194331 RepID=H9M5V8_9BIVA|nr:NADH dehydrogenase subunit 2 [Solen strictus]AER38725.1 NADH dehydrogenase subunit 2 [Solen strictus]